MGRFNQLIKGLYYVLLCITCFLLITFAFLLPIVPLALRILTLLVPLYTLVYISSMVIRHSVHVSFKSGRKKIALKIIDNLTKSGYYVCIFFISIALFAGSILFLTQTQYVIEQKIIIAFFTLPLIYNFFNFGLFYIIINSIFMVSTDKNVNSKIMWIMFFPFLFIMFTISTPFLLGFSNALFSNNVIESVASFSFYVSFAGMLLIYVLLQPLNLIHINEKVSKWFKCDDYKEKLWIIAHYDFINIEKNLFFR